MIDPFTTQISFLVFEALFCLLSALVYAASRDPMRIRKGTMLALDISCGFMLTCEYLFYVFRGSTAPVEVFFMRFVNAGVYYLIVLLLLFYAMIVAVRLFGRFDLKKDMPCRKRFLAVCGIVAVGLVLVTVSQFTGIYYYFDSNNVYQRGPLFWLSAVIPTFGALLVASIIFEYRHRISRIQEMVLISYVVLPIIGEIIQILNYGNSIMNICVGLAVLLMFFENMIHKEKEILKASRTEFRTGLANEHGYVEWLNAMKGNPDLKDYAAVFFDLRKFSDINRKYGVENGNRILAGFGNILRGTIEEDEILGRQYGNKFIAIVRRKNLDRLLERLRGTEVTFKDTNTGTDGKVTLTAHVGVYDIDRTDLDGEDLLVFGGHALSTAKSRDNEEVVWLTQELLDSIAAGKKLESDIRLGIKNGEFEPFYQPKVNLKTGKICGAEALSRWNHDGKILAPGSYIPIMEANDTICILDLYILKSVCKDSAGWLQQGIEVPMISVNFSRRNLTDPDLADHIDKVVRETGIPKQLIEIEVTEGSDEFSVGVLRRFADNLHRLGYKISIDDFGTAGSSLTLLREITFDTLKIDKGFVDHDNQKDITILTCIIRLANEINMDIVAEGVEQKAQVDILEKLGVEVIQGFYFDKALSKEKMAERLRSPKYGSQ